jgi:hypothetical protein
MVELLFLICLRSDPGACQMRSLSFVDPAANVLACAMAAQPLLAQRMERWPEWELARWKCGPAGRVSFDDRPGEPA